VVASLGVLFCLWLLTAQSFQQAGVLLGLVVLGVVLRDLARREGARPGV
jgi:multisubunit Na+/H+ antiporter MnhE subunit